METKILVGNFYKSLNTNSFLIIQGFTTPDEGTQFASGTIVTQITSLVNHLFINLYSQLDFVTKLTYEFEHLQTSFKVYPKLKSKDILFGDFKRTSLKDKAGTIYELTDYLRMIMSLRNEIVHNASIDSIPKVYQKFTKKSKIKCSLKSLSYCLTLRKGLLKPIKTGSVFLTMIPN